jgi:hypothetical protein
MVPPGQHKEIGMRMLTLALAVLLVPLAGWLGWPVSRGELGLEGGGAAAAQCRAPDLPDVRKLREAEGACKDGNAPGCRRIDIISREFFPHALASLGVYTPNRRFRLDRLEPEWKRVGERFSHWNGLEFEVLEREIGGELHVLVAFRGTDTWGGIVPYPNDFVANLSWLTQYFNPWDQYRTARNEFRRVREAALARAKGRVVRFKATGHSLGGGLAVHVTRGFPCTAAVVFNSSCVSNELRYARPFGEADVVHVRENRDWLSKVICAPADVLGWNIGQRIYEANWVRDRPTANRDDLETALDQHSIGRMSLSMARRVVCCAQRARKSAHPDCGCPAAVMSGVEPVRRLMCDGRRRERAGDPCDFTPLAGPPAATCAVRC